MISSLSFCALHCFYVLHVLPKKPSFNKVICKIRLLGGEKGQFRRNRPSNASLGMKILQNKITGTQTRFSTNFGGKLSFIMSFIFPQRFHCCYIYFTAPIRTTPIITLIYKSYMCVRLFVTTNSAGQGGAGRGGAGRPVKSF
jgi:hypothetical protein